MNKKLLLPLLIISSLLIAGCGQSQFVTNNAACPFAQLEESQMTELKNYIKNIEMKITPVKGDTIAKLITNLGEIDMLLYTKEAPETTKNFIELAMQKKYDGTIFHRVIDCFMIQGGDFENGDGTGGYSYKGEGTFLKDEFGKGLKHLRGTVSMANAGPNTGGSQFFIVNADYGTPWLDGKHSIVGFVYKGMNVVDKIAKVKKGGNDNPLTPITLETVEISTFGAE